jgi:hypothetical protein
VKKFLVLYRSSVSAADQMAAATPEQAQAGLAAWMEWAERNRDAIVEHGTPLGSGAHVADGAVSESESDVSGYSIVQAESKDAAASLFKDHPHLGMPADSSIELLEFLPLPGA